MFSVPSCDGVRVCVVSAPVCKYHVAPLSRVFEIDGIVHLDPVQRVKDEARDNELRVRYGWLVRRIWWEIPVYQPREFVRIVKDTLRSRP